MKRQSTPFFTALGLSLCSVAFAQTNTTASSQEEVLKLSPFEVSTSQDEGYRASNSVSATRMNVPLKELPVTINAFTQEFIDDQKARDLIDIVRFAPGVTNANPEFVGGQALFSIRGFNSNANLRNGFVGPAVLDTVNVARVEVVKGPASLLYGNIEPGGVVNYITKRPMEKQAFSFGQSVGTDGYYRTELDVNTPLGTPGKTPVLFRFVGAYDHAADFYSPSGRTGKSFDPSITWNIGPKTQISADYEYYHSHENPTVLTMQGYYVNGVFVGPATDFGLPWDFNAASNQDYRDSIAQTLTIDAHTEIAGWTLRAAYNRFGQKIEQFGTARLSGTDPNAPVIPRRGRIQFDQRIDDSYQIEATREFEFNGGKVNFLVGYQTGDRTQTGSQRNLASGIPPPWDLKNPATWNRDFNINLASIAQVNPFRIEDDRDGIYAVAHASFLKNKLHVLAGLRHSTAKSATYVKDGNGVEGKSGVLDASEQSPQFGVLYELAPAVSAYVSYSKSFRPEGGSLTINNVPGAAAKAPLIGKGYDAGFKFNFDGGRLSANLAVFTLDYDGSVTERVVGVDPITNNVIISQSQDGRDRSKGVELDFLWTPNAKWQVYGTYAYLDSYAVTNTDPTVIGVQRANTVKDTANLFVKYKFTDGWMKGFSLSGGPRYTGPRRFDPLSPYYFKSNIVVDLLASYGWNSGPGRYSVDLNVRNMFDEKYYDSAATTRGEPFRTDLSFRVSF